MMSVHLFLVALILVVGGATYVFWIRPILKTTPQFKDFYDQEESLWTAFRLKMMGIKQWLTTAIVTAAGAIITIYDFVSPLIAESGVDIHQIGIAKKIPPDAWPLITISIVLLLGLFRWVGQKRNNSNEGGET